MPLVKEVSLGYEPRPQFVPFHTRSKRWACLVCHRRAGKALDVDTLIPVASGGYRRMGDLAAGDVVYDERGIPCTVVVAHPVMRDRECYEVLFDDGASIVCDGDHLWHTLTKTDRSHHVRLPEGRLHRPKGGSVKTTVEIAATIRSRGESNHSIVVSGPLARPRAELPIDPYVFGLWLGDGSAHNPVVTTADEEIVETVASYAAGQGMGFRKLPSVKCGLASQYSLSGGSLPFRTQLRHLGVLANKHIPAIYLHASVEQRKELLRGLMDTDGSIDTRSGRRCEITQVRKRLADEILALLRSLGVKATISPKVVAQTTYWRVNFSPPFNPFRLARKASIYRPPTAGAFSLRRYIVDVQRVPSRPVRCITVDSPSRLYLASEHLVPTHNTVACIMDLIDAALTFKPKANQHPGRFAYIGPTYAQTKDVVWGYLKAYTAGIAKEQRESDLCVYFPNGARVRLYGAENYDRLRGIYLDGLVVDEVADIDPRAFNEVLRPALSDRNGWAVFIGTPKGQDEFYKIWKEAQKNPDWFTLMLKASETGILPQRELEDARRMMRREQYEREYECSFAASVEGAYYAEQLSELDAKGQICGVPWERSADVWTAWDLGHRDATAIWFAQLVGREIHLIDYYQNTSQPLDHYVKHLRSKPYTYGGHLLPHDAQAKELGTGKSRQEVLQSLGINCTVVKKNSIEDGINAVRMMLDRCWFDRVKCEHGLDCLRNYRAVKDEKHGVLRASPQHNWASHAADSFRYLAMGFDERPQSRAWDRPDNSWVV